jgi:acetyltransferase
VNKKSPLDALFAPRNVALVGASDRNWAPRVFGNLQRFGYEGEIYLVNPNRTELWGRRCYASLADLPEAPDHLALFVPADQSLDILEDGTARGARSATFFAAGFGEGGDAKGLARAARLKAIVARTDVAVVGPNCMGLAVGRSKFSTVPDEHHAPLQPGPVAAITQSGMLVQTVGRGLNDAGLPLAYLLSAGNQTGLTIADYVSHLADDPDLRVIVCYIEAVRDAPEFLAAARKAKANSKTVVVTKIGGSEESRAAALAHTGSLAGSLEVFDAFAEDAGIVRVDSLEDIVQAAEYLSRAPRPRGNRIALMTNSGALRSLTSEAGSQFGISYPSFSAQTQSLLKELHAEAEVSNPYDFKRTLPSDLYIKLIEAVHRDPNCDLVLLTEELPRQAGIERKVSNFRAIENWLASGNAASKPLAVFSPISLSENDYMRGLREELPHIPWLHDISKSLRTIGKLADRSRSLPEPSDDIDSSRMNLVASWREFASKLDKPVALDEVQSKAILAAYGVRMPREIVAASAQEAAAAASEIGYPVVVKGISADIAHKSDAGLVKLNLSDADEVAAAAGDITEICAKRGAKLEGILVAQQVKGGLEMVAGIHRDAEMGPVVMAGLGGIWLELFKDVAFAPPWLDHSGALAAISKTRSARLLAGYRGAPAADADALADIMVALGALAREFGNILESVDINPVLVRENGRGALALDGLIVLRPPSA